MIDFSTFVGSLAAFLTTASYVPQVLKTWRSGETVIYLSVCSSSSRLGLPFGMAYGFLQRDPVIVLANGVSLGLEGSILSVKIRAGR